MDGLAEYPRVTVVIVTYGNRLHSLRQVVDAVFPDPNVSTIIIVDNASSYDISAAFVLLGRRVVIVKNEQNEGSAGGYYRGLEMAYEMGAQLIWCLDDDNVPERNALNRLLQARLMLGADPDNMLVSYRKDRFHYSMAISAGIRQQIRPNQFQGISCGVWIKKLFGFVRLPRKPQILYPLIQIDFAPYGGFLFDAQWIRRVGLPNKEFFVYMDDFEYSLRMRKHGAKIFLCGTSILTDVDVAWYAATPGARSLFDKRSPDMRVYYSVRNQVVVENMIKTSRAAYFLNMFLAAVVLSVWALWKGASVGFLFRRMKLISRAYLDGSRGNLGRKDFD